ncbi:MAG: glucose-6-phosphate dehydrogenase, partial [Thermodesulfobacteriota bacterium]
MADNEDIAGTTAFEHVDMGETFCDEPMPGPAGLVIFGASGDLTKRKLIPALYRLFKDGFLSEKFFVVGAARTAMDDAAFRHAMEEAVKKYGDLDGKSWAEFAGRLYYRSMDYGDSEAYASLASFVREREEEYGTGGNRLFYLATPPTLYAWIVACLGSSGMSADPGVKVVIEKPFGRDLASARELLALVHKYFTEDQVFRIDHYLGKETVQNIVMLRFANAIFEPLWNRRYIDHVQITAAETLGVEKRAGYYEEAGILRDMFQNHMLQVMALVAMEPPSLFASERVRDERVKLLRSLRPLEPTPDRFVLGRYEAGEIEGGEVAGYTEEPGVAPDSNTPTFAAMKLYVDNWRWNGVPFYLRSGKRLASQVTEVLIQFKEVPHMMFDRILPSGIGPNVLVLRIQPEEKVMLTFHTKSPGSKMCLRNVTMDFRYTEGYTGHTLSAYERVLLDAVLGDKMLFVRNDDVDLSWSFLTPAIEHAEKGGGLVPFPYGAGSWGPR